MEELLQRITQIDEAGLPGSERFPRYLAAIIDASVADMIRADLNEDPGVLRRHGLVQIADILGRP